MTFEILSQFDPIYIALFAAIIVMLAVVMLSRKRRHPGSIGEQDRQKIDDLLHSIPHTNEIKMLSDKIDSVMSDFTNLDKIVKENTANQRSFLDTKTKEQTEQIEGTKKILLKEIKEQVLKKAESHIEENSITRENFESLKSRIEDLIGSEIDAQRLQHLEDIFGKHSRRDTISWQCKLVKMLRGGLAPKAEEDVMLSESISQTKARKFLQELMDLGVVTNKKIDAYFLNESFEWLYKYVDDVELLMHRIENATKNEKAYENFMKENLELLEGGLILQQTQYQLSKNHIVDLLCVDSDGKKLFIELKYPAASFRDRTQIKEYRDAYSRQPGSPVARFMLVAPTIGHDIRDLLTEEGLEFREVMYNG